jgi:hypothetical protein
MKQNERGGNLGTHGREGKFVKCIVEKSLNERDLLEYLRRRWRKERNHLKYLRVD